MFTLPKSAQEVFDTVLTHARTMKGERCTTFYGCSYRNETGGKCFAGVLIPDSEYDAKTFERKTWGQLVEYKIAPPKHKDLIVELQQIHDVSILSTKCKVRPNVWWEIKFWEVAKKHALNYTFPLSELNLDEIDRSFLKSTCENILRFDKGNIRDVASEILGML